MYGISDKYIKMISAMYENNTAAVKVGNEISSWFCIKSGLKQGVFYPLYMDHFDGLCLKEHKKGNGRPWNQMGRSNSPGIRLY